MWRISGEESVERDVGVESESVESGVGVEGESGELRL